LWQRERVRDLDLSYHDLDNADLDKEFNVGSFACRKETMKLKDLYAALKTTYCGSVGAEYMHITSTEEKRWLQQRLESVQSRPKFEKRRKATYPQGVNCS
jgi:2-oxoglutarate dehydrogenase E1 component